MVVPWRKPVAVSQPAVNRRRIGFPVTVHGGRFRHGGWWWENGHGGKIGLKKKEKARSLNKREELVDGSIAFGF